MANFLKEGVSAVAKVGTGIVNIFKPLVNWILNIRAGKFIGKNKSFFKQAGLGALEYKAGDFIQKLGNSKAVKASRQPGGFSSTAKDNAAEEVVPKAQERAKREAKELTNIAQFTSTSLKKNYEVAKNSAHRSIDAKKKRVVKKSNKNTAVLLSDIKYKVSKQAYDKKASAGNAESQVRAASSQVDQINTKAYRSKATRLKNKDNQEVVESIDKKLEDQDNASRTRDKILGASLVGAIAAGAKNNEKKITDSDRKTSENIEKLDSSVKQEEESTRKMISEENKNITQQVDSSSTTTQELIVESSNQTIDSNAEGLKAISEQLYETERSEEEKRVEEIKAMNESQAKIDELIDSNNTLYNTTRTLDRTNMMLGNVMDTLQKPAGMAQMVQDGLNAFGAALGGFLGTIVGTIAALPPLLMSGLGDLINMGVFGLGKLVCMVIDLIPQIFLRGLGVIASKLPFGGKVKKVLDNTADKIFGFMEPAVDWLDKTGDELSDAFAWKGNEWGDALLSKLGGMDAHQYQKNEMNEPATVTKFNGLDSKIKSALDFNDDELFSDEEKKQKEKEDKKLQKEEKKKREKQAKKEKEEQDKNKEKTVEEPAEVKVEQSVDPAKNIKEAESNEQSKFEQLLHKQEETSLLVDNVKTIIDKNTTAVPSNPVYGATNNVTVITNNTTNTKQNPGFPDNDGR